MGPKNTSGSPSSQAIRTAVSKALVVVGDQSKIDAVWLDGARSDRVHDRLERSLRLYRERPIRLPASGKSEDSGEYHTTAVVVLRRVRTSPLGRRPLAVALAVAVAAWFWAWAEIRLTTDPSTDFFPAFSPDRHRILQV